MLEVKTKLMRADVATLCKDSDLLHDLYVEALELQKASLPYF